MALTVTVADHPLLDLDAFVIWFAQPLDASVTPASILAFFEPQASAPICSSGIDVGGNGPTGTPGTPRRGGGAMRSPRSH